jgi:signal transduction histidine kinase
LAIALPPLVDLATRIGGLFPDGVEARSTLTLASTLVLVILCALRVHPRSMVLPAVQGWDERGPATARDSLEFASGVAHELNNPLMAVAGWAEVALKKGAPTLPMHQLIEATRAAADAVARLDQITRGPAGTRG